MIYDAMKEKYWGSINRDVENEEAVEIVRRGYNSDPNPKYGILTSKKELYCTKSKGTLRPATKSQVNYWERNHKEFHRKRLEEGRIRSYETLLRSF